MSLPFSLSLACAAEHYDFSITSRESNARDHTYKLISSACFTITYIVVVSIKWMVTYTKQSTFHIEQAKPPRNHAVDTWECGSYRDSVELNWKSLFNLPINQINFTQKTTKWSTVKVKVSKNNFFSHPLSRLQRRTKFAGYQRPLC